MGYKSTDPCLEKAYEDERLFILMTRDETSPEVVMEWIKLNLRKQPPEKLSEAFTCAMEMLARHDEMVNRKEATLALNFQKQEIEPLICKCKPDDYFGLPAILDGECTSCGGVRV